MGRIGSPRLFKHSRRSSVCSSNPAWPRRLGTSPEKVMAISKQLLILNIWCMFALALDEWLRAPCIQPKKQGCDQTCDPPVEPPRRASHIPGACGCPFGFPISASVYGDPIYTQIYFAHICRKSNRSKTHYKTNGFAAHSPATFYGRSDLPWI